MNKKKLLFENFVIYGLGQVIYKVIPLIMLPILTDIMPESSYYLGINDLVNTIVGLVAVFGLMGLYDAVFRLFFDYSEQDETQRKEICSTALGLTILFSILCFLILVLCRKFISGYIFADEQLSYLVVICGIIVILTNVENIVLTPTRMKNDRKKYILGNTLISLFSYAIALIIILNGFYIIALPLGMLLSLLLGIVFFGSANRKWFSWRTFNRKMIKPLLQIGIPLFSTFLIFWVFSSFDRIMIVRMLGVTANGVFAVASKLAQLSQLLTVAFSAGWSYFNFATMNDKQRTQDFSKIIEYIFAAGTLAFLVCRLSGNMLVGLLFTEEYKEAGKIFAYMFIAPIINMLFQLMGSQFLIIKKPAISTIIAGSGVIINIIMNYFWINKYGISGASYATVVSYMFIMLVASYVLKKRNMFEYHLRECIAIMFFAIVFGMDVCYIDIGKFAIILVIMILLLGLLYAKDFVRTVKQLIKRR